MIGFLIALLSGALMSVQGVFNTQVTKTAGMWVSNGWVQLSAFAVCAVLWLFTGRDSIAAIGKVEPKYMLLGGVIGAGITWTCLLYTSDIMSGKKVGTLFLSREHGKELENELAPERAQFRRQVKRQKKMEENVDGKLYGNTW